MDKEEKSKGSFLGSTGSDEDNSRGFVPRTGIGSEVRALQLSESFFAADTLDDDDDDDSAIIPPTQDLLIPSTPPCQQTSGRGGNDDTTISNLDETCLEDISKDSKVDDDDDVLGSQNDMTQDLPDLMATQQILVSREHNRSDEDDEWQLRFSESQETQELLPEPPKSLSKDKDVRHIAPELEPEKSIEESDASKIPDLSRGETKESLAEDVESDDDIEPSQSCLSDAYSGFGDQLAQIALEAEVAHSTPDNTINAGTITTSVPGFLALPSPIGKPVEPRIVMTSQSGTQELSRTKSALVLESEDQNPKSENLEVIVCDTEPQHLPKFQESVSELTTGRARGNVHGDDVRMVCDTIELLSSVEESVQLMPASAAVPRAAAAAEKEEAVPEAASVEKTANAESGSAVGKKKSAQKNADAKPKEDVKSVRFSDTFNEETELPASGFSTGVDERRDALEELPATQPTVFLPPSSPSKTPKSRLPRTKKSSELNPTLEKSGKPLSSEIGTYTDAASVEMFLRRFGVTLDKERISAMLSSKSKIGFSMKSTVTFVDNKILLEIDGSPFPKLVPMSPQNSGSSGLTTTSSSTPTMHSNDADISGSSSAKSGNSSAIDSIVGSQEVKTSTQNSQPRTTFERALGEPSKLAKISISPIKLGEQEETKSPKAAKAKRGGRKAPAKRKAATTAARKRARTSKPAAKTTSTNESDGNQPAPPPRPPRERRRGKKDEPSSKPSTSKTNVSSSEDTITEVTEEAYSDTPYTIIIPGVRVMARWKDGFYYPGIVCSQELEGRWSVRFDDTNDIKAISQESLIKVPTLETGTSVLAMTPDGFYDPGIICGNFREGNNVGYDVELDSGVTKRYARRAVILSGDQAKALLSSRPPRTPATMTINLDNIMDGKRKRKSAQSPDPAPDSLKKSRRRTTPAKVTTDPNVDASEDSAFADRPARTSAERPAETTETEEEKPDPKQRPARKRRAAKAGAAKTALQSSSKVPKLFKNYAFLITKPDNKLPLKTNCSDTENASEDLMSDEEMDRDELVKDITSRGGTIIGSFEDIHKCRKDNIYLLASSYLRTMKYIQCLAAGVCCIKYIWVKNCCFKSEILPLSRFHLPAGKSIITDTIIEWHGKSDVLTGLRIALVSAPDDSFVSTWSPVLLAAKADFVQKWSLPSSKTGNPICDVLITNIQCPSDILQAARRRKIPIVSSEWIIQCLIVGSRVPYDGHPKFKHDFTG